MTQLEDRPAKTPADQADRLGLPQSPPSSAPSSTRCSDSDLGIALQRGHQSQGSTRSAPLTAHIERASSRSTEAARRTAGRTCLVAVDGSVGSVQALIWGLRYASDRGMCVEVLTVWPPHRSELIHEVPGHVSDARWTARAAQGDAIRQALEEVPDGPVTAARLENADAGAAIVRASARCDLVVLGSNLNDSSHSLTERVLAQAACDVVVVGSSSEVITTTTSVLMLTVQAGRVALATGIGQSPR